MLIEVVCAPDCHNAEAVRTRLASAIQTLGFAQTRVHERIDQTRPSPSVLIDGVDIMGEPMGSAPACRLDVPTTEHLIAILSETTMTAAAHRQPTPADECWCCGGAFTEKELVRLGKHPEAALCLQCALWVKRRAVLRRHQHRPSISSRIHRALGAIRNGITGRGWHERTHLGPALRWIDRHLP